MAHPRTYSNRDPYLKELRKICLALPESSEVEAWGRPTFRGGEKIFAVFGGPDEKTQTSYCVIFKPDPEERPALVQDERFFSPRYWGPGGWLGLDFEAAKVDWQEVSELVDASYRQVALKRMIKALDES
jgi:predicted DNA-binding protein (MmcQ/YjbR family)